MTFCSQLNSTTPFVAWFCLAFPPRPQAVQNFIAQGETVRRNVYATVPWHMLLVLPYKSQRPFLANVSTLPLLCLSSPLLASQGDFYTQEAARATGSSGCSAPGGSFLFSPFWISCFTTGSNVILWWGWKCNWNAEVSHCLLNCTWKSSKWFYIHWCWHGSQSVTWTLACSRVLC